MSEIYQKAYVTICASSAASDQKGFLSPRPEHCHRIKQVRPGQMDFWNTSKKIWMRQAINHFYDPSTDHLSTRAWAYQERLMSSRVLSYRADEVVWECRQACWHECGRSDNLRGYAANFQAADRGAFINALIGPLHHTFVNQFDYWHWIVIPEYTRRFLTYELDRLPALAALAEVFRSRTTQKYLAGLWDLSLLPGMTWRCVSFANGPTSMGRAPKRYRAPTWTWASVEGPIGYNNSVVGRKVQDVRSLAVISRANCKLSNERIATSSVIAGSATLSGPVLPATFLMEPDYDENKQFRGVTYSITFESPINSGDFPPPDFGLDQTFYPDAQLCSIKGRTSKFTRCKTDHNHAHAKIKGPVQCLLLYCYYEALAKDAHLHGPFMAMLGLVLSARKDNSYERIGLLEVYDRSSPRIDHSSPEHPWLKNLARGQEVTIV
jgi:hypothetical protein